MQSTFSALTHGSSGLLFGYLSVAIPMPPRRGTGRGVATDGGDDVVILASIPTADIDGEGL